MQLECIKINAFFILLFLALLQKEIGKWSKIREKMIKYRLVSLVVYYII